MLSLSRPNHVITFLRKEHLPPNEACFQVPLTFTKFDLRDYLWNLYNVEVTKVRSYVKSRPLAEKGENSNYRPQPLKIMTVELKEPFQWPEVPEDKEPWNKRLWDMRQDVMRKRQEDQYNQANRIVPMLSRKSPTKERKALASVAKELLEGKQKWTNDVELDPKWDALMDKMAKAELKDVEETPAEKAAIEADAKEQSERTEPKPTQ